MVDGYMLLLQQLDGDFLYSEDIGKPEPDEYGRCRYPIANIVATIPAGGSHRFVIQLLAYGAFGESAWSVPSNVFRHIGKPGAPSEVLVTVRYTSSLLRVF